MRSSIVPVLALLSVATVSAAHAEEKPDNGVPEFSIAQDMPFDAARASLAASGIRYGLNYTGEYYDVTSGGLSRGSTYNGLIEVYTDIDLERLLGWKGAAIHANAFYVHGAGPTAKTGSLFAVSNLEGYETFRLDELWLEQSLLDDKLKVKIGSIAADTMFFISDTAAVFLNGTFGWPGILASNTVAGGPGYPLTSMGAVVTYAPNDNLTLMGAVFNGSPADPFAANPQKANNHGTDFRFGDGELMILEGAYKYDLAGLGGTVKVGGWKQFNAPEGIYTDFRNGAFVNSDYGIYGIIDQTIYKEGDDKSVSVFGRVSGSPTDRSRMDFYFDTGILFAGFVPGRAKDTFGAAFGWGQISQDRVNTDPSALRTYESVLELNYVADLRNGVSLAPDFQYFWNPGAVAEVDHAAVWGARLKISY
ncbi:MAG: carbohydrate porin [Proteobacteria bacterium]|nr:carbohydrate porin [Pseudomonadota bacterium]